MSSFWIFFVHESVWFNYRPLTAPLDPLGLISGPDNPWLWVCSLSTSPKGAIPSLFISSVSTLRWPGMVNMLFPFVKTPKPRGKLKGWLSGHAESWKTLLPALQWNSPTGWTEHWGLLHSNPQHLFINLFATDKISMGNMGIILLCKKLSTLLVAALLLTLDEHPLMFIFLICLQFIYRYRSASLPFPVTFGAKLSVRDSLRWLSIQTFLLCLFSWEVAKKEQTKGQFRLHSLNTVLFITISSEVIHEASQVMPTLGMGLPEE